MTAGSDSSLMITTVALEVQLPVLVETTAPQAELSPTNDQVFDSVQDPPEPVATEVDQPSQDQSNIRRAHDEIYYDELWKHKRGSPLLFPGPSDDLPLPYRQNGFDVGDVGILKKDKPFDFLFNIFLPSDDPINAKGVPDSFQPCQLPPCDTSDTTDSCFVSPSVSNRTEPSYVL